MDAIYLLIPIASIFVIIGVVVFFWAVKNDQFEDLEGPAHSILFDDDFELKPKPDLDPDRKHKPKQTDTTKKPAPSAPNSPDSHTKEP